MHALEQVSISHPQLTFVTSTRNHQLRSKGWQVLAILFFCLTQDPFFVAAGSFARPISCQRVLTPRCGQPYSTNKHHSSPSTITAVSRLTKHKATVVTTMKARAHMKNVISIYGKPGSKLLFQIVCVLKGRWTKKPRKSISLYAKCLDVPI